MLEIKVYIFLPRLVNVRTVTEHMRPLSNLMGIEANRQGEFRIKVQTEDVALETSWTDCGNPKMDCESIDYNRMSVHDWRFYRCSTGRWL